MRKNIIVSNRLPVNVTKLEKSFLFQSSSGASIDATIRKTSLKASKKYPPQRKNQVK